MTIIGPDAWLTTSKVADAARTMFPRLAAGTRGGEDTPIDFGDGTSMKWNRIASDRSSVGQQISIMPDMPFAFTVMCDVLSEFCTLVGTGNPLTALTPVVPGEADGLEDKPNGVKQGFAIKKMDSKETIPPAFESGGTANMWSSELEMEKNVVKIYAGPVEHFSEDLPPVNSLDHWRNYFVIFLLDPRGGQEVVDDLERRVLDVRRWRQGYQNYQVPPFFFAVLLHTVAVVTPNGADKLRPAGFCVNDGSTTPSTTKANAPPEETAIEKKCLALIDKIKQMACFEPEADRMCFRVDFDDKEAILRTLMHICSHALAKRKHFDFMTSVLTVPEMEQPPKRFSRLCRCLVWILRRCRRRCRCSCSNSATSTEAQS
jgi:hypothetical protein